MVRPSLASYPFSHPLLPMCCKLQLSVLTSRRLSYDLHRCGPSRLLAPELEAVEFELNAEETMTSGKAKFVRIDVDKHRTLSKDMDINEMPTVMIYVNGDLKKTIVGAETSLILGAIHDAVDSVM